jgi:hypothetical protein
MGWAIQNPPRRPGHFEAPRCPHNNVAICDSELDGWQPGEINTRVRLRPSSRIASNADKSGHPRAGSAAINPSKRMEWAFGPGFNQVQQFFY